MLPRSNAVYTSGLPNVEKFLGSPVWPDAAVRILCGPLEVPFLALNGMQAISASRGLLGRFPFFSFVGVGLVILMGSMVGAVAATFTVTNTADSGPGTLRQAVTDAHAAPGADTIVFDPAVFSTPRTITLASVVNLTQGSAIDDITIIGPGQNLLTVSGNNVTRHFINSDGDTSVISGMTLTAGNKSSGGSVSNGGFMTLTNMVFRENTSNTGGAVHNTSGAVLTIAGCNFINNTTTGTNTNGNGGSALQSNGGNVTIRDCTMTGGTTRGGGGALRLNGGSGAIVNITNSIIENNTSGNAGNSDGGGGIYNDATLTITGSTIRNNTAGEDTPGGGIRNEQALTLIDTVVTNNSAGRNGGGIYDGGAFSGEFLRVINSTISHNVANTGLANTGRGGGIYAQAGTEATITGSTIHNNLVRFSSNPDENTVSDGGGIWGEGELVIDRSTISSNTAMVAYGGVRVPSSAADTLVTNSTIVNNSAPTGGGLGKSGCGLNCKTVSIGNTIIFGNAGGDLKSGGFGGGGQSDVPITSIGYTLVGTFTQGALYAPSSTDLIGVDPGLGALQDNGGPTPTHAPLSGSPVIDRGKRLSEGTTDQRGLLRPYDYPGIGNASGGDGSDIGAVEDQPPNTQPGSNVTASAPAGDAMVTFTTVSAPGFTSFAAFAPQSATALVPPGYRVLENAPAYDITTSATFTGPLTVCFTLPAGISEADFSRVRLLHRENGVWVDRTILAPATPAPNFSTRQVCARTDSLSPFVLALAPTQLLNISTRLRVLTGDNALIGGFIITGSEAKKVIIRALGPSLGSQGVAGVLQNPTLELIDGGGRRMAFNDDWRSEQQGEIEATTIPPGNEAESAIVATLAPGAYTAVMRGAGESTGVGLVEVYDLAAVAASELANISSRGFVERGDNVMIGGFIIGGGGTRVIVRGIGPSLGNQGVAGALQDPTLQLVDENGTQVRANDNWKSDQQAEIEGSGIPPSDEREAALVATLAAGNYTAILRGQGETTGVGLVEVYNVP